MFPWWVINIGTHSSLLALCEGNSQSPVVYPHSVTIMRSYVVSLAVTLIKLLNEQWSCRSFETPWRLCKLLSYNVDFWAWWRHPMETFSASLALCAGNSPVSGEFPAQRPVTWSFDVLFDMRPNKRLSKQWRRRWFETPSRSLWQSLKWISASDSVTYSSYVDVIVNPWLGVISLWAFHYWPFMWEIHGCPVDSSHKWPPMR